MENIINSIYEHVLPLEDIQFFVQYASKVLPVNPEDANGALVWQNILTLQQELTAKREVNLYAFICSAMQFYFNCFIYLCMQTIYSYWYLDCGKLFI